MKKCLFTISALLMMIGCLSAQQRGNVQQQENARTPDNKFVAEAIAGGIAEIDLGTMAETKGSHPMVKEFGMMMVTDHRSANQELIALARSKGHSELPERSSEMARKEQEQLARKSGRDFDQAFADQMIKDHEKTIDLFSRQAKNGKDKELKDWAAAKLPILKEHLQHAQRLSATLKKDK